MPALFTAVLPVFLLIAVGYACAKFRILGPAVTGGLNFFVARLALPALLFETMAQSKWTELNQPGFVAAFTGGMIGTFFLTLFLSNARDLADASIEGLGAAYANTGFMGIPLCLALFGKDSLPPAIIATLLTACVLFFLSLAIIEKSSRQTQDLWHTFKTVGWSMACNPLLFAPVLGVMCAVLHVTLPAIVLKFATLVGNTASPCALVAIGLLLVQPAATENVRTVCTLIILKLAVQPVVTGLLAFLVFEMPLRWAKTALILSALPTGVGAFLAAQLYDRQTAVISRVILFSTIISIATISFLAVWLAPA